MAYIKEKTRGAKKYRYAAKSVRLPDGTVKTIQKIISGKKTELPATKVAGVGTPLIWRVV